MLFVVDVGNTSVNFALMDNGKIIKASGLPSLDNPSPNFYLSAFKELIASNIVDGVIFSSVKKELNKHIESVLKNICSNVMPMSADLKFNFELPPEYKETIGMDIVASNEGAVELFDNCIVVDIGTATTFQTIKDKVFIGAIIAPGMNLSAKALHEGTSLLPKIDFYVPEKVIGVNTVHCMQSGIIYGQASMIEGLISRILDELGEKDTSKFKVIATGQSAKIIGEIINKPFDVIDDGLIFKGLSLIYNANKSDK